MTTGQNQGLGGGADSTPKSAGDGQDARASGASHISGAVSQAKSSASSFLSAVGLIQTDLETQVLDLEGQVTILEAKNYGLQVAAEHLQQKLNDAKKDCYDPDSPEAMAGDILAPPTNSDGTLTGDF